MQPAGVTPRAEPGQPVPLLGLEVQVGLVEAEIAGLLGVDELVDAHDHLLAPLDP